MAGHPDWVRAVAAVPLPGGRNLLAAGSEDGTVRLWDPAIGDGVCGSTVRHTGRKAPDAADSRGSLMRVPFGPRCTSPSARPDADGAVVSGGRDQDAVRAVGEPPHRGRLRDPYQLGAIAGRVDGQ
jgi:WD40 repeat protein